MSNIYRLQDRKGQDAGIYYEVDCDKAPIGEGGMGRVFKGDQIDEYSGKRRPVAVKFLYSDLPPSVVQRAKREASIRIPGDDNLIEMIDMVAVNDVDEEGMDFVRLHVISELLQGVMLHDLMKGVTRDAEGKDIPYARMMYELYANNKTEFAVTIIKAVLKGIKTLHNEGYVHRDIDPSNVMITQDRKIKLIDFGIVRQLDAAPDDRPVTLVGSFIGKPEYAAPELVLGDVAHQDRTTDIYAAGILLFEMATGHKPFTGSTFEIQHAQQYEQIPLHEIENLELRSIVGKATKKLQNERYQNANEFLAALESMSNGAFESDSDYSDPYNRRGKKGGNNKRVEQKGPSPYDKNRDGSKGAKGVGTVINEDTTSGTIISEGANSGTIINESGITGSESGNTVNVGGETTNTAIGYEGDSQDGNDDTLNVPIWKTYLPWAVAAIGGLVSGSLVGWFV